jgi:signal transduction histidine kinase
MQRYLEGFDTLPSRGPSPTLEFDEPKLTNAAAVSPVTGFLDEILRVHEYERPWLGQELHDTAGQLVVALQLSVANLRNVDADSTHDGLFEDILDTVHRIDSELRSLAFLHYPAELGDRSLASAIQALVRGFGRRTGIETSFRSSGDTADAAQPVAIAFLRIAQEALVNVHRHSRATAARVTLELRDDEIRLTVSDNGVGMARTNSAQRSPGIGLQGMRHRVESLGGRFAIRNLRHGFRVSASIALGKRPAKGS